MKPVILETPYAGKGIDSENDFKRNLLYLRACIRDCLVTHKEAPFASHAIYTQPGVLIDEDTDDREYGIQAGFAVRSLYPASIFYIDLGMSRGMEYGMRAAEKLQMENGHKIIIRNLPAGWEERAKLLNEKFPNRKVWGVD